MTHGEVATTPTTNREVATTLDHVNTPNSLRCLAEPNDIAQRRREVPAEHVEPALDPPSAAAAGSAIGAPPIAAARRSGASRRARPPAANDRGRQHRSAACIADAERPAQLPGRPGELNGRNTKRRPGQLQQLVRRGSRHPSDRPAADPASATGFTGEPGRRTQPRRAAGSWASNAEPGIKLQSGRPDNDG